MSQLVTILVMVWLKPREIVWVSRCLETLKGFGLEIFSRHREGWLGRRLAWEFLSLNFEVKSVESFLRLTHMDTNEVVKVSNVLDPINFKAFQDSPREIVGEEACLRVLITEVQSVQSFARFGLRWAGIAIDHLNQHQHIMIRFITIITTRWKQDRKFESKHCVWTIPVRGHKSKRQKRDWGSLTEVKQVDLFLVTI